jgi:Holliday junction resolvase RusA-like endonuclease
MCPSVNSYWRSRVIRVKATGREMAVVYVTHEGKAYQQRMRELLLEQRAWHRTPHPLSLRLLLCFKDERVHDLDNRVKPLLDALKNGNVYLDDKQVKQLEVREGPLTTPEVCFVWLEEILPDRRANAAWIKGPA